MGDDAAVAFRVDELVGKVGAALFFQACEDSVKVAPKLDQLLRQLAIRGNIAGESDRIFDVGEKIATGLVAVKHLLDGPGDVVFRVAQIDIQLLVTEGFHLDQVAKAEGLKLVAILDEDIEVGIGHRGLVFAGGLERNGLDIVFLSGLLLHLGIFLGIDKFDMNLGSADDRIFLEQVPQLRNQRRQQRMGLR